MFEPKKVKEFDNKATFVIGYRNLYNIVVIFIAGVYLALAPAGSLQNVAGIIIFIMGCKWFISQCRENLDAMYIEDSYKPNDTQP